MNTATFRRAPGIDEPVFIYILRVKIAKTKSMPAKKGEDKPDDDKVPTQGNFMAGSLSHILSQRWV